MTLLLGASAFFAAALVLTPGLAPPLAIHHLFTVVLSLLPTGKDACPLPALVFCAWPLPMVHSPVPLPSVPLMSPALALQRSSVGLVVEEEDDAADG